MPPGRGNRSVAEGAPPGALVTGLGLQWLVPGTFAVVARAVIGGPRAPALDIELPSDPSLAGTTLGLQALLQSPAAAFGAAWSEPLTLELE